ncbi:MAG: glycosyltransferase family 2 protein [Saprospiraceae bacterium]|nr:glycosyltransferase family 2 protein [Saprospiraceae bacterium]
MLSILIPIFNFDIRPLVADLHGQCEALGIGYEIVCFDDDSTAEFKALNKAIWKMTNVIYREMPQNLGRSAIRNALGKAARFENLLFMDCDSKVVSPDYIKKYLEVIKLGGNSKLPPNSSDALKLGGNSKLPPNSGGVIYGGRSYADLPPQDNSLFFHWHYGKHREQTTASKRNRSPYHSFMTNNFLVPKAIFLDILFDETLRQYGHEDTLFGMELAQRNVPIWHIDNPLEHIGLEPVDEFLRKTEQGIENLASLAKAGSLIETKLLSTFFMIKKLGLAVYIKWIFLVFKGIITKQLKSVSPSLFFFDFYKLGMILIKFGH